MENFIFCAVYLEVFGHSSSYSKLYTSIYRNILFIKITLKNKFESDYQTMVERTSLTNEWTQELIDCVWYCWQKERSYIGNNGSSVVISFCGETTAIAILCILEIRFNQFLIHYGQSKII